LKPHSTPHYKEKLRLIQQSAPVDKDMEGLNSFAAVPEKLSAEVEDHQAGDIEETLLRNTGNHIKFRK
jgi:hypothetical protein